MSQTKNPERRSKGIFSDFPRWAKKSLFPTPGQSLISLVLILFLGMLFLEAFQWLIIDSVWEGTSVTCRKSEGACLVFLREKATFILFGFYPRELLWRPLAALLILFGYILYAKNPSKWDRKTFWNAVIVFPLCFYLMKGGKFGLELVPPSKWGGLPLTVMLATVGIIFSYPLGIILALGRAGKLPLVKSVCIVIIELIRGVPLISFLFMSSLMFPLFLPEGVNIHELIRAQAAIIIFMSAYMAEVVRGGLASIPKGQYEAADALGLGYWKKMGLVILPQALRIVIPPTVNTFIGMFKDTSLVIIIALFDLMNTTKTSQQDTDWLGFSLEAYLFAAVIYFIFCYSMSSYSKKLEIEFAPGEARKR